MAALGVAGRALEPEDLAAGLRLERGPLGDRHAARRRGPPGGRRRAPPPRARSRGPRAGPSASSANGSSPAGVRGRSRHPHAVHEHVAVDHPGLAQALAHPLAAAHRHEAEGHEQRRLEAAVAAGPQRDEGERGDDERAPCPPTATRAAPRTIGCPALAVPKTAASTAAGEADFAPERLGDGDARAAPRPTRYHRSESGHEDRGGRDPPRGRPARDPRLEVRVLQERGGEERVEAGEADRDRGAQRHHRQVGRVEVAVGEAPGSSPSRPEVSMKARIPAITTRLAHAEAK